jgi:hypothetical protein
MLNVNPANAPSPSIPLPRGEREAKPLSLDGREVGERVFAKYSTYLIAEPIEVPKWKTLISTGTSKHLCSKHRSTIAASFL